MKTLRTLVSAALVFGVAAPAFAAEPKLEGQFSDWSVYSRGAGQSKICYAVTKPSSSAPATVNHGEVFFLVSNWKNGAASEQPSFLAGYPLKPTRTPKARVGGTAIPMYAADNEAFIEASTDERALVKKMRAGADMTIQAVSARGTETRYQFSLKGVTAALKKSKAVCS